MSFRYLVFDCDGVLVDSELLVAQIVARVKTEMGRPISVEEQIEKFVGMGVTSPFVREELNRLPEQYLETVKPEILSTLKRELQPIPGIKRALAQIPEPKCVASSSPPERIELALEVTGLLSFFKDAIFSGLQVTSGKPSPDLFLFAANKMQWDPEACLVIEDSEAGVAAAHAAGMQVLAFTGGSHMRESRISKLRELRPQMIFSDMNELPEILKKLRS